MGNNKDEGQVKDTVATGCGPWSTYYWFDLFSFPRQSSLSAISLYRHREWLVGEIQNPEKSSKGRARRKHVERVTVNP
jgi:hypothetical protein